jgi:hypothetical protein
MSDRRAALLQYPRVRHGAQIQTHLCAPGLGAAVRNYITEEYQAAPEATSRVRRGMFDPGGPMLNFQDPFIRVRLRGWAMCVMPSKVPVACALLEERLAKPPKLYGKLEAYRWSQIYGLLVLTREDAETFLAGLLPYRKKEALRQDAALQQLAQSPNVQVRGARRPAEA